MVIISIIINRIDIIVITPVRIVNIIQIFKVIIYSCVTNTISTVI